MATQSSILAWRIPWEGSLAGYSSCSRKESTRLSNCMMTTATDGKESACNAGDPGLIPGLGRTPGEVNGYPVQYSCLENSMDRGAWQATVHRVEEVDAT